VDTVGTVVAINAVNDVNQTFQLLLSLLSLPMLLVNVNLMSLSILILMKARSRLTCLLFHPAQPQWSTLQILPVNSVIIVVGLSWCCYSSTTTAKSRSYPKQITS
jgi:hypothetical protein